MEKINLIWFRADWCIPCREMKPAIDAAIKETGAFLQMVDIGTDEGAGLAMQYGVRSVPTLVAIGREEQNRLVGAHSSEDIVEMIEELS